QACVVESGGAGFGLGNSRKTVCSAALRHRSPRSDNMNSPQFALAANGSVARGRWRRATVHSLQRVIEMVVLVLVCVSPWPFGAVEPWFQFYLYVGIAVLLVAWAISMLLQGRLT